MSNKKNIEPVDLKSFYRDRFDGSDLQKISLRNPVPHKCTSNGQEYYYYNANLSGLMNLKNKDGKLKYFEFETIYIKGFADGLRHLKNKEGIKRKDFNTPKKREILKKDLNHFLYKREFLTNHKGLKDFIDKTLLRWSEDSVYTEGYYNGFLHSILTLCDELNMDVFKNINNDNQTPNKNTKLTAKHYALYYLFKTYAYGEQIPTSDGGFSKADLEKIGKDLIGKNGNGFYKAVRELNKYDLNSEIQLKSISNNWKEILLSISNNDEKIIKYIKSKGL